MYHSTVLSKLRRLAIRTLPWLMVALSITSCNQKPVEHRNRDLATKATLPEPNFQNKHAQTKPKAKPATIAKIKAEPMSAYGNPSYYDVKGKRYNVMADAKKYDVVGIASWYGKDFDGKLTSNREVFDMNQLSAASKILPLPSYVKVTNLENNKSIVVRVNDRGPYKSNRIIDLSFAAAKALSFVHQGTTKVHITAVSTPDLVDGSYYLQVASFSKKNNAKAFKQSLGKSTDQPIRIRAFSKAADKTLYRVEVGPYLSSDKLHTAQHVFRKNGFVHTIAIVG